MGKHNRTKLNQLIHAWPRGAVYSTAWLEAKGYSRPLLNRYKSGKWIYSMGHGAVARAGDRPDWTGGLYAFQTQQQLPVHVGGKTALHMSGYGHFLPLGKLAVDLFGLPRTKLPSWFLNYSWGVDVRFQTRRLFIGNADDALGLTDRDMGAFSIRSSTPERAILEMLDGVPSKQTFSEAKLIFENLTTLRSQLVQTLLEQCNSIKAKRLFLYLAEECHHAWFTKLKLSQIELGKGKRSIGPNGRLNAKYLIVVPRET